MESKRASGGEATGLEPTMKRSRIEAADNKQEQIFTKDEAELYDRQIRLWGVEAQRRLNSARILIIGVNGLGAEVAKNIILGGVKSVHLMDCKQVTEFDAASQFLVGRNCIGENRATASLSSAQRLNPMVTVTASDKPSSAEPDEFFTKFNVICSIENTTQENIRLDQIARDSSASFFAADVYGLFSYIAIDLGKDYKYTKEKKVPTVGSDGKPTTKEQTVDLEINFVPYNQIIVQDKDDNQLWTGKRTPVTLFVFYVLLEFLENEKRKPAPSQRDLDLDLLCKYRDIFCKKQGIPYDRVPDEVFEHVYGEVGPACAITGGVLAQEIVKAVSGRDDPLNNLFLYNPMISAGGSVVNVA